MDAPKKKTNTDDCTKDVIVAKSVTDLQRIRLQRLMEHPEKLVSIPEPQKEKVLPPPPEFNRNVMGSSAGAGSGEFHVYRHIRRREYARQKYIGERAEKELKDIEYHRKIETNKIQAEERTAKKRAKRMKKKMKLKQKKHENSTDSNQQTGSNRDHDEDGTENSDDN